MSRTMSGIPTSGAGDVKLDGDPNAFTGTNTFDVNIPTSSITTSGTIPGNNFLTKTNADTLYTGSAGDVTAGGNNAFSGTNTFNTNIPTSTITTSGTIPGNNFLTKTNADTLYTGSAGDVTEGGNNDFTGTNTFNIVIPTSTKVTSGTIPGSDFLTRTNADTLYGGGGGDALLAAGDITTPQDFTGINEFSGGNLLMTKTDIQNFQMIQTDINASVVNSFIMTGKNNRIQQTGTSNGVLNEFKQSGGSAMTSTISQLTTSALIYQDSTTATFITKGRIGIGKNATAVPICPLEIQGGATSLNNGTNYGYLRNNPSPAAYSAGWGAFALSIYASQIIFAANYVLASDERIKRDITDLPSTLVLIDKIKPKTYKYRDTAQGDRMTYGFIAQELEQVLPDAILTTRAKIPNIMKKVNVIDGVFTLEEATDLMEGDVIAIYDDENKQYDVTITEMISDKSFTIDMVEDLQDQFFIYGKFVDDFKAIEHNDLLPVMIKGIQELNAKNKALEDRLAILEATINNRD